MLSAGPQKQPEFAALNRSCEQSGSCVSQLSLGFPLLLSTIKSWFLILSQGPKASGYTCMIRLAPALVIVLP